MSSSNLDVGTRRYLKRKSEKPAYKSPVMAALDMLYHREFAPIARGAWATAHAEGLRALERAVAILRQRAADGGDAGGGAFGGDASDDIYVRAPGGELVRLEAAYVALREHVDEHAALVDELLDLLDRAAALLAAPPPATAPAAGAATTGADTKDVDGAAATTADTNDDGGARWVRLMRAQAAMLEQELQLKRSVANALGFGTSVHEATAYAAAWRAEPFVDARVLAAPARPGGALPAEHPPELLEAAAAGDDAHGEHVIDIL